MVSSGDDDSNGGNTKWEIYNIEYNLRAYHQTHMKSNYSLRYNLAEILDDTCRVAYYNAPASTNQKFAIIYDCVRECLCIGRHVHSSQTWVDIPFTMPMSSVPHCVVTVHIANGKEKNVLFPFQNVDVLIGAVVEAALWETHYKVMPPAHNQTDTQNCGKVF